MYIGMIQFAYKQTIVCNARGLAGLSWCEMLYRVAQKLAHLFPTPSNVHHFSNVFHYQNQDKNRNNTITNDPTTPQVCCYTTMLHTCLLCNNRKQDDLCTQSTTNTGPSICQHVISYWPIAGCPHWASKEVQTVPTMAQYHGPALVPRRMTVRGHCRIVWNACIGPSFFRRVDLSFPVCAWVPKA